MMPDSIKTQSAAQSIGPPEAADNPPGLAEVRFRMATHSQSLRRMVRAARAAVAPSSEASDSSLNLTKSVLRPLAHLDADAQNDPALALLDAWASVVDVLTFYQERIANEGYLRTARERRSVLELGNLVGYQPHPGVAASTYLAYTTEKDHDVTILAGAKVQSVPGPGELPQTFETFNNLDARAAWNLLHPRLSAPWTPQIFAKDKSEIIVKGMATALRPGQQLMVPNADRDFDMHTIYAVELRPSREPLRGDTTRIVFRPAGAPPPVQQRPQQQQQAAGGEAAPPPAAQPTPGVTPEDLFRRAQEFLTRAHLVSEGRVAATKTPPPPSAAPSSISDLQLRMLTEVRPDLEEQLLPAMAASAPRSTSLRVFGFRVVAGLFGHNAPAHRPPQFDARGKRVEDETTEWKLNDKQAKGNTLWLDSVYDIAPGTRLVIDRPGYRKIARVESARIVTHADYALVARVTELTLGEGGQQIVADLFGHQNEIAQFEVLRQVVIYASPEPYELADVPIVQPVSGKIIELEGVCEGMEAGRTLLISGERTRDDAARAVPSGVFAVELVELESIGHRISPLRSVLHLSHPLQHAYIPSSLKIFGNVVRAGHGETRQEVLGSGQGTRANQSFMLKQGPLTYVSAPVPGGVVSTLRVRVNGVEWHEAPEGLSGLGPTARRFEIATGADGQTRVIFGNGEQGARLPTGSDNVTAEYRVGIGRGGNVPVGALTQLLTRPLGVKDVTNPLSASGGADREQRAVARRNIPRSVTVFGRLVSAQDYEDFARSFGGITKALAQWIRPLPDAPAELCVTVAGATEAPLDPQSQVCVALRAAFGESGDPLFMPRVVPHRLSRLSLKARVQIDPDFLWSLVEPQIRSGLLASFSYEARELAQPIALSQIIERIERSPGVISVEILTMQAYRETEQAITGSPQRTSAVPAEIHAESLRPDPQAAVKSSDPALVRVLGAEVLCFSADVRDTLILEQAPMPRRKGSA